MSPTKGCNSYFSMGWQNKEGQTWNESVRDGIAVTCQYLIEARSDRNIEPAYQTTCRIIEQWIKRRWLNYSGTWNNQRTIATSSFYYTYCTISVRFLTVHACNSFVCGKVVGTKRDEFWWQEEERARWRLGMARLPWQ